MIEPRAGDLTSLQPLGDARVLVEFEQNTENDKLQVVVNGCFIERQFVEASCFSADQCQRWESAILLEVLEDA